MTRTSGAAGPLVLAPAEGVGALRAPCHCLFTHAPCSSVGQQTDFYPCPLWECGSTDGHFYFLFLHTSNLLFLLGTENAMGGSGSLAVYAILLLLFFSSFFTPPTFCLLGTENAVGCVGPWLCMPSLKNIFFVFFCPFVTTNIFIFILRGCEDLAKISE